MMHKNNFYRRISYSLKNQELPLNFLVDTINKFTRKKRKKRYTQKGKENQKVFIKFKRELKIKELVE